MSRSSGSIRWGSTAVKWAVAAVALFGGTAAVSYAAVSASTQAVSAPVNTVAPSISGSADVGRTLTANPGTWTGDPTPTYAYQWQRCTEGSTYDSQILGPVGDGPTSIALDSSGNVYTANYAGGSASSVSKLLPNGTPAGGNWPVTVSSVTDIYIDSSDNIFVAGGSFFSKLTTSGTVSLSNISTGGSGARGIVTDSSGNIYVASASTDTVAKFTSAGSAAGGVWPVTVGDAPTDIAIDSSGNLFTSNETSQNVSKVTPSGTVTSFGSTGPAPQALAIDSSGDILVPNFSSKLVKIAANGSSSTVVGDTGTLPRDIVLDASNNAFIVNSGNSSRNVTKTTPAGSFSVIGNVGAVPYGLARDADGNFYVANEGDDNVSKLSPALTCTDIPSATNPTYTLTATDEGKKIKVKVTATNSQGSANATSPSTGAVGPEPSPAAPTNGTAPSVSGTAEVGSTLTADPGTWNGYPTPTIAYQWQRCEQGSPTSSILSPTQAQPMGIAVDSSGTVYYSSVFANRVDKITPAGATLSGGATGNQPIALALDSAGNAYTANFQTDNVTKITPGGVSSVLGTTGAQPFSIAVDPAANVYVANEGSNNVTKITPGGVSSVLGTTGSQPRGIALDSTGNVYTANFGSDNVTKITPGGVSSVLGTTGTGPRGIALDSTGNVYTSNMTSNNVTKITPGGVSSVLGSTGTSPRDLALDSAGNVYTTNFGSNDVTKITSAGVVTASWASTGSGPQKLAIDSADNVYTTNGVAGNISKITSGLVCTDIDSATDPTYELTPTDEGKQIRVKVTATNTQGSANTNSSTTATVDPQPLPVNTEPPSVTGDPEVGSTLTADPGTWSGDPDFAYQWQRCEAGPAEASVLGPTENEPQAVAVDSAGNAYTPNWVSGGNGSVTKITPDGTSSTLGTTGVFPRDIAVDAAGNVYTTNFISNTVTKITPGGAASVFGNTGSRPIGIAIDSQGNVYTGNSTGNSVTRITPGGSTTNITFPGITGAGVNYLAIDSADNVYAAWNNQIIYKIAPNGTYTNFGYITGAMLVSGIAVDSSGNVYTSNSGNKTVGKFTPGGVYSVLASSVPALYDGPTDITLDSDGNVYVSADYQAWKITPDGTAARFGPFVNSRIFGIAVDSEGIVYLPLYDSDNVTKFAPSVVCTDITGADDPTYKLTDDDEGKKIRVKVTATNTGGSASANSGSTATVEPQPVPENVDPPSISGTAEVGSTLTAEKGTWSGNPTSYAFQWQRCDGDGNNCVDIDNATDETYKLIGADEGKKIRVKVTATNEAGSASADSDPTATVDPAPVSPPANTSPPTISGSAQQGQTLTADPGTWDGKPAPTFSYQWQRCEQAPATPSILGTTGDLPNGIVLDKSGNVYTANLGSNNVTKITQAGSSSTYGTTGNEPNHLVFDSTGNLFTSNQASNNVSKITPGGNSSIFSPAGFLARAIAIDSSDNLYVPNQNGGNVTKITPAGTPSGTAPFYTWAVTGPGSGPIAAVVDGNDNVYVATPGLNTVTKITPAGSTSEFAPTGAFPYDIAIDRDGNVYTSNVDPQTVTKITPAGEASTLGRTGSGPVGIAVDAAGNVYTANQSDNTVTQISPFGVSSVYSTTGDTPRALTVDDEGNVYTANLLSDNVTKIGAGELDCTDIDGATEDEYLVSAADVGKKIRVKVTGTNTEGEETVDSGPTATVVPDEVSVTIEKSGGTITSEPAGINCGATCTANFAFNQEITLTAAPESGKGFDEANSNCPGDGWNFDGGVYLCVVKADQALDVSISFRPPKTIWVGTGSTGAGGSCETPDFNTVGAAAQEAIPGDTIHICEGEFLGAVTGKPLTYQGEGAGKTIIGPGGTEGNDGFVLFDDGATSTFRNLTIRGAGRAISAFSQSGGPLTIENVAFEDNQSSQGGAIFSDVPVNISGSTFSGNNAAVGSAVIAFAPVTVENSTLTGNSYELPPQGIRSSRERGVLGGGPSPDFFQGGVIVTVTYYGSESTSDISLTNVTLADNDPGLSASLTTLCFGEGPCPEGSEFPSGDIEVDNSIIAENGAGCGTPYSGQILGEGNVIQNSTTGCDDLIGGPPAPTSQVSASQIALQPLALNSPGDTETMALGSGSVARGAAVGAQCPETDQRGVARPTNDCDSGAYQFASSPSGKPKLKVSITSPKRVKAGQSFEVKVKTTNRAKTQNTRSTASSSSGTTAKKVKTCVKLPTGVVLVDAGGARVSGKTLCWKRSSLAAGKSVTYRFRVRTTGSARGTTTFKATVSGSNAAGAKAEAKGSDRVVISPKPQPRPKPPTG